MRAQLKPDVDLRTFVIDDVTYKCTAIEGWSNYYASTCGFIVSTKSGDAIVLNNRIIHGYCYVTLCAGKDQKQCRVHRLIAEAFLDAPSEDRVGRARDQVNHLDRNTQNNKVANLEWVSSAENHAHFRLLEAIERGAAND